LRLLLFERLYQNAAANLRDVVRSTLAVLQNFSNPLYRRFDNNGGPDPASIPIIAGKIEKNLAFRAPVFLQPRQVRAERRTASSMCK